MPRLFTGIPLPQDLSDKLDELSQPLPGASWVKKENFHVSIRFAGDIENTVAQEFSDELARIDQDVFEIQIEGLGVFGGKDPKVLWAGIAPSEPLETLARAHERAARAAGLPPERRSFKAHITLARLNHPHIDALTRLLSQKGSIKIRPFLVENFVLFSSRPIVGGGPYVMEEVFPLRGGLAHSQKRQFFT